MCESEGNKHGCIWLLIASSARPSEWKEASVIVYKFKNYWKETSSYWKFKDKIFNLF